LRRVDQVTESWSHIWIETTSIVPW
jgi:hypothetical protein